MLLAWKDEKQNAKNLIIGNAEGYSNIKYMKRMIKLQNRSNSKFLIIILIILLFLIRLFDY